MALQNMWVKGLTPSLVKRAEIELNETPATRAAALEELILAIKDEPGFTPLMDEEFLLRFLRAKKFEVGRAFNTMKNYYDFKHRFSGDITDFLPKDLKSVFETDKVLASPKRGFDGEAILILSAGSFNIDKFTPEHLFATTLVTAEIGIEAEFAQVCGCRIIFDFGGLTWWKLKHYVNPSFIGGVCKAIQDVMPIRIRGLHVVNEPVYFTCAYQTIKPILSKKLKERVHFHGSNLKSLHKLIPKGSLTEELGGDIGKKDFKHFRNIIFQNNDLMERINSYTYNGEKSRYQRNSNNTDNKETTRTLFNVSVA